MERIIQNLLRKGETENLEFKSSFGKETIESLSAFANSKGGIGGVSDLLNLIKANPGKRSNEYLKCQSFEIKSDT